MSTKFYYSLALGLWFSFFTSTTVLFGQDCPPPGFPDPGNTCPEAPILCQGLDGYCSTLGFNNIPQPYPYCNGWTLNNDEWFAFYAGTDVITIEIIPSNCFQVGSQAGFQAAIYSDCPSASGLPVAAQCPCTTDPFVLTANNFIIGNLYYIVFDGCQGDICDYQVNVLEGRTYLLPCGDPDVISGPTTVCPGNVSSYSIDPISNATSYNWSVAPSVAGVAVDGATTTEVHWTPGYSGPAQVCVGGENGCFSGPQVCVDVMLTPPVHVTDSVFICPGDTVYLNGQPHYADGSVIQVIHTTSGCDTILRYDFKVRPYQTSSVDLALCPGKSVNIDGKVYNQPGTVLDTIPGIMGCDTIVTYNLSLLPYETRSATLEFCPGKSVSIHGQVYNQPGTVQDTIPGIIGCDTIVAYTLSLLPYETRSATLEFCPGKSVSIHGQVYSQPGTVLDTIPGIIGCDTIVTYNLVKLPYETRSVTLEFCPGKSVSIHGQVYTQPGTVLDTIPGIIGCDTIVTYTLNKLPQPERSESIFFCPGDEVTVGNQVYTQPGIYQQLHTATPPACDTLVTYKLQYHTPAPSIVHVNCPANIQATTGPSGTGAVLTYAQATASSDCVCPGINLVRSSGLASGSLFPAGMNMVCFTAKDSCGNTASCCFNINVSAPDDACDVKEVGCMKYELLTITEDMAKNRTYRIRVTNNCSNKLLYTAIQLPNGVIANEPHDATVYTAPSGDTYKVRNPNYSPQYSIRFSSLSDSIHNGQSEIFKYTLPAQTDMTFIHVVSRLFQQVYLEVHLNTFYCPIGVTPSADRPGEARNNVQTEPTTIGSLRIIPNPASSQIFVDSEGDTGELMLYDVLGRNVLRTRVDAPGTEISISQLTAGLYQAVFQGALGIRRGVLVVE